MVSVPSLTAIPFRPPLLLPIGIAGGVLPQPNVSDALQVAPSMTETVPGVFAFRV